MLAATGCRPTVSDDEAADAGSETGSNSETSSDSETGSIPAECPSTNMDLPEAYSGVAHAAAMLPAGHGGTNYVTSSCGGGGVDAAYHVTSQKTSNYSLYAIADDLGTPLNFHVHAGDSCHGPELYCATAVDHQFDLMLAEGESVTVVVDTDSDLVIPEGGFRYSVGISWGAPTYPPCEPENLHACNASAVAELENCMAPIACEDVPEATNCYDQFDDSFSACTASFCPDDSFASFPDCEAACDGRTSICETACDANTCEYEHLTCMDTCGGCNFAVFEFEFTGGCELVLPGPPLGYHGNAVGVAFGGAPEDDASEPGLACGDPGASDVVWASDSVLLLCDVACESFANVGAAQVHIGVPFPCE